MSTGNSQFLRPRGFAPHDWADTVEVGVAMRVFADRVRENGALTKKRSAAGIWPPTTLLTATKERL